MRDCFELLKGAGLAEVRQVRVAGGGARSSLWRRIMASVLGVELVTVNSREGAAYGAALLAGVGAENWPSVDAACESVIAISGRDEPEPAWAQAYEGLYPRYRELYPALRPTFARLGA
jgi:xylulokinase